MIKRTIALLSPHWRFRSAKSGQIVTKAHALAHPSTTVRERIKGPCGQKALSIEEQPDWYARLAGAHTATVFGPGRKLPSHQITVTVNADDLSRALAALYRHWGGE